MQTVEAQLCSPQVWIIVASARKVPVDIREESRWVAKV